MTEASTSASTVNGDGEKVITAKRSSDALAHNVELMHQILTDAYADEDVTKQSVKAKAKLHPPGQENNETTIPTTTTTTKTKKNLTKRKDSTKDTEAEPRSEEADGEKETEKEREKAIADKQEEEEGKDGKEEEEDGEEENEDLTLEANLKEILEKINSSRDQEDLESALEKHELIPANQEIIDVVIKIRKLRLQQLGLAVVVDSKQPAKYHDIFKFLNPGPTSANKGGQNKDGFPLYSKWALSTGDFAFFGYRIPKHQIKTKKKKQCSSSTAPIGQCMLLELLEHKNFNDCLANITPRRTRNVNANDGGKQISKQLQGRVQRQRKRFTSMAPFLLPKRAGFIMEVNTLKNNRTSGGGGGGSKGRGGRDKRTQLLGVQLNLDHRDKLGYTETLCFRSTIYLLLKKILKIAEFAEATLADLNMLEFINRKFCKGLLPCWYRTFYKMREWAERNREKDEDKTSLLSDAMDEDKQKEKEEEEGEGELNLVQRLMLESAADNKEEEEKEEKEREKDSKKDTDTTLDLTKLPEEKRNAILLWQTCMLNLNSEKTQSLLPSPAKIKFTNADLQTLEQTFKDQLRGGAGDKAVNAIMHLFPLGLIEIFNKLLKEGMEIDTFVLMIARQRKTSHAPTLSVLQEIRDSKLKADEWNEKWYDADPQEMCETCLQQQGKKRSIGVSEAITFLHYLTLSAFKGDPQLEGLKLKPKRAKAKRKPKTTKKKSQKKNKDDADDDDDTEKAGKGKGKGKAKKVKNQEEKKTKKTKVKQSNISDDKQKKKRKKVKSEDEEGDDDDDDVKTKKSKTETGTKKKGKKTTEENSNNKKRKKKDKTSKSPTSDEELEILATRDNTTKKKETETEIEEETKDGEDTESVDEELIAARIKSNPTKNKKQKTSETTSPSPKKGKGKLKLTKIGKLMQENTSKHEHEKEKGKQKSKAQKVQKKDDNDNEEGTETVQEKSKSKTKTKEEETRDKEEDGE